MPDTLRETLIDEARSLPLQAIDVSRPDLFGSDAWPAWFSRLRREAPVHYCADSRVGPYWSVTTLADIKQVDADNVTFSSERGGIAILGPGNSGELQIGTFIAMDEPRHAPKRNAVSPAVAPMALKRPEPLSCRCGCIRTEHRLQHWKTRPSSGSGGNPSHPAVIAAIVRCSDWLPGSLRPNRKGTCVMAGSASLMVKMVLQSSSRTTCS